MNFPKRYVRDVGTLFKDSLKQKQFYDYLLEKGTEFNSPSKSKDDPEIAKECVAKAPKECFYNAQRCALDTSAEYYEGFGVCNGVVPTEHGWLVKEGKVYDPTWERMCKTTEYFGIEIPKDEVRKSWVESGMARQLLWEKIHSEIKDSR